ncbi:hypothetical protein Ahy_B06g081578 [Arachis hypogaea]|uniref:Uncharacterized protein n=1 Tax=Arachis hypogaea TaxID=3818 RepID=A0A444YLI6_ARAHY|nr:hypothetical protein Ahy_B06g081578 [Arachis hypogaea]
MTPPLPVLAPRIGSSSRNPSPSPASTSSPVSPSPLRKGFLNFIGTMGRNSDFITLMYTNWKAVPKQIKKRI